MLWKLNGKTMKTPSSYKDNIEDLDNDSYTSKVTGALIDNVIAIGMLKLEMSWDYCTEEEAEELLQASYQNPMLITIKCPSVRGGMITAPFRVSKRTSEMYFTGNDEDTSKSRWKVSFNLMQKSMVASQKGG
ncbi:MAG: hypothetical protein HFJ42_10010 [Clostridia bacterium]|nr:hypothetical protein [Clostridia bacterium]